MSVRGTSTLTLSTDSVNRVITVDSSYRWERHDETQVLTSDVYPQDITPAVTDASIREEAHFAEDDVVNYFLKYYHLAMCIFGIFGNLLSLAVLSRKTMRVKTTCMYMLAISMADLTTLTASVVYWVHYQYVDFTSSWFCKIGNFVFYLAIHTSVAMLVAMTVERYLVVAFPLRAKSWITRQRTLFVIGGTFSLALAINLHHFWTRTEVVSPSGEKLCTDRGTVEIDSPHGYFHLKIWPWIDACAYSFLPLLMLSVFNVLIIRSLRISERMQGYLSGGPGVIQSPVTNCAARTPKQGMARSAEKQVTIMLLTVTSAFIVLTGPLAVTLIVERMWDYEAATHEEAIYNLINSLTSSMMFTNHAINFLLYCAAGRAFRKELKSLVCTTKEPKTLF